MSLGSADEAKRASGRLLHQRRCVIETGWMRAWWCVFASLCVVSTAAADEAETVEAAVGSFNEADLGRPFNAGFTPITGNAGRTLFPDAKKPRKTVVNDWSSEFIEVDNLRTLSANAKAWGIGSVSGSTSSNHRYMVFRVRAIEYVLELDDATEPRTIDAATGAVYYARKIYYGRMYETILSGTQDSLNASVAPTIRGLPIDASVDFVKRRFNVNVTHKGRGLAPTTEALFARTPTEIKAAYQADKDAGPPVPVLVEYRRIAGVEEPAGQDIDWSAPSGAVSASRVRTRVVAVDASNSDWTSTGLVVGADEVVVGRADGKVQIGGWGNAPVHADASTAGGLEMRIGTTGVAAGKAWMSDAGSVGEVKFRVRDTKHSDNKGAYAVIVVVIPRDQLMSDCGVVDTAGETTACP